MDTRLEKCAAITGKFFSRGQHLLTGRVLSLSADMGCSAMAVIHTFLRSAKTKDVKSLTTELCQTTRQRSKGCPTKGAVS